MTRPKVLAYATDLDILWYMRVAPQDGIETIERFLEVAGEADDSFAPRH